MGSVQTGEEKSEEKRKKARKNEEKRKKGKIPPSTPTPLRTSQGGHSAIHCYTLKNIGAIGIATPNSAIGGGGGERSGH